MSRGQKCRHIRNENYAILCNSNEGRRINNKRAAAADVEIRGRSMIDSSSSFAFFLIFLFFYFSIFKLFDHSFPPADAPQPPRCPILLNFPRSNDWCAPNRKRDAADLNAEKKKRKEDEIETWQFLLFPNMELLYVYRQQAHCIDSNPRIPPTCIKWMLAGIWQRTARSVWDGKRNVKRKTFGVSVECFEIHRRLAGSTRLSIYSRMYSALLLPLRLCRSSTFCRFSIGETSSRNNCGPIVTGPVFIKRQHNTRFEKEIEMYLSSVFLFFRLCPAAIDDIRTSLLAWTSYLDSCRIVSRPSIIDASCRLFDIDVHKCILSSR